MLNNFNFGYIIIMKITAGERGKYRQWSGYMKGVMA